MKFTYYGHSCFGVEIKGIKLLFDPFISYNELAKGIDINQIKADYILVSHGHQDHIADLISIGKRTQATIIAPYEVYSWLLKQNLEKVHPMNIGGKWTFEFGSVKCLVAQHSSGLPDGSYGGNPMGFLLTTSAGNFYYSGDTALTLDMQLIPRFAQLNFAVFPIGDNFTMGYEDALMAAEMVNCKKVIGVHYDTFDLIRIDHQAAKNHFVNAGYELLLPEIGQTIQMSE
ncbi:MAG: metal-dependent hydrolase [Chitinophagaceae bacterium]